MIRRKEAHKLLHICTSARECHFHSGDKIIKAVSVANRDNERPEVVGILNGHETLWPPGACNCGMALWVQHRTWYPIAA